MGYIDETTKDERNVERLIRFMKSVENPSWMIELVEDMKAKVDMYEASQQKYEKFYSQSYSKSIFSSPESIYLIFDPDYSYKPLDVNKIASREAIVTKESLERLNGLYLAQQKEINRRIKRLEEDEGKIYILGHSAEFIEVKDRELGIIAYKYEGGDVVHTDSVLALNII